MKKVFLSIFCILLIISGCSRDTNYLKYENNCNNQPYIKSVWICYFELEQMIKNNNEKEFRELISENISKIEEMGFNTITVQVRAFCDSIYKSNYFPLSDFCIDKNGKQINYDPLNIICDCAKEQGINVEAWINPYRVSSKNDINELNENSPAKKWTNSANKRNVLILENGIYLNPAREEVNELIINGINEIILNYDVCAIQFDDYFYPSKDTKIDEIEYKDYIDSGGDLNLSDWRRENINKMIKAVYKSIKSKNKNISFGISPSGNISHNFNDLYADVKLWCTQNGYVDYICPQIYYGFKNEQIPFMNCIKEWSKISKCRLLVGLPLYKSAKIDKYASTNNVDAQNEFINNNNIISRQINYINKINNIDGYYVFSYNSLFDENKKEEVHNMINAMQNSSPN